MDLGCITQFLSNIKDILRRSISSVEETGVPEEDRPAATIQ